MVMGRLMAPTGPMGASTTRVKQVPNPYVSKRIEDVDHTPFYESTGNVLVAGQFFAKTALTAAL